MDPHSARLGPPRAAGASPARTCRRYHGHGRVQRPRAAEVLVSVVLPGGDAAKIVGARACIEGMRPLTIRKHLAACSRSRPSSPRYLRKATETRLPPAVGRGGKDRRTRRPGSARAVRAGAPRSSGKAPLASSCERPSVTSETSWWRGRYRLGKTTSRAPSSRRCPRTERIVPNHRGRPRARAARASRPYPPDVGEGEGEVTAEAPLRVHAPSPATRIFLAELRGSEAWEYVLGLNTGHPGSVTTATDANGAVRRPSSGSRASSRTARSGGASRSAEHPARPSRYP